MHFIFKLFDVKYAIDRQARTSTLTEREYYCGFV